MAGKKSTHVSEEKKNIVTELSDLIKNKKTILIVSIKNIPSSQFQEIVKKLRGKAIVKVPKKNLIFRALDSSGNEAVKKLKEQIKESIAILFSDLDGFELAAELVSNKSPTKAKTGQEAPLDIEISAGPTDLVPGPAISELGALGIKIQIEKGKITIKEPRVIVKKGEKISSGAADIMNKLDIKPFSVGFIPLSAFDTREGKLYLEIKVDREETIRELKTAFGKTLPFAVEIGYPTKDTISFLIGRAGREGKIIESLVKGEKVEEKNAAGAEDNKQLSRKTENESKDNTNNSSDQSEPSGEVNTQLDKSKEEK